MGLSGKLETEIEVKAPSGKFFHHLTKELHNVQHITDSIHGAEFHEGDEWHTIGSVKTWTYIVDGKKVTNKERIEAYDEEKKILTFDIFEGEVSERYKSFKVTLKVNEKEDGSDNGAIAKWIVEYEKVNEGIPDPKGHLEYVTNVTKDVDAHLSKPYIEGQPN
ncbi:MLP-like protein 43 [Senna tora]|uniref:MLP-like protein 43 n=1 Tax=Senna tora TaxID=362788 RepID=A0A834TT54_9FABA|nr:MLP-like protein 43 [Senna tora]